VVVIAPLFGYKLDLLVSTFNDLAPQQEDEILATQAVDSGYGGYTAPSYTARSLKGSSWPSIGSRILARYPSIPGQGLPGCTGFTRVYRVYQGSFAKKNT